MGRNQQVRAEIMKDEKTESIHPIQAEGISDSIRSLAQGHQNNCLQLLALLRLLEELHREIRDDLFMESLPTNRQALYALLRDIEREGGWPYIPVAKIKDLMSTLESDSEVSEGK
jgi:hypothetical protein